VDRNHADAESYRAIGLGPLYAGVPALRDLFDRELLIDRAFHDHTGVDVTLYADGPNAESFDRARDNIDVADMVADVRGQVVEGRSRTRNAPWWLSPSTVRASHSELISP